MARKGESACVCGREGEGERGRERGGRREGGREGEHERERARVNKGCMSVFKGV